MGSTALRWLLLLACAAVAAGAQEPPGFLIEKITIEGLEREAAREIVLSESLLHEGKTYSEEQLREAVYRVKRLPFVVDADMALGKGSERGAYELVIHVDAAKPIAYSVELQGFQQRFSDSELDDNGVEWFGSGTLAARKFVGSRGLLFGSVQGFDTFGHSKYVQAGYTRYGLFRPGAFATVALSSLVGSDYQTDNLQGSLQAGIPLAGNHALRGSAAWTRWESDAFVFVIDPADPSSVLTSGPGTRRSDVQRVDLEWIFDTTNDPLLPTEGLRLTTLGGYTRGQLSERLRGGPVAFESDNHSSELRSEGRRYWSVTPRQSLALRAAAWYTKDHVQSGSLDSDDVEDLLFVEGSHAIDLWDFAKRRRVGDLRWENAIGVERFHERTSAFFGRESRHESSLQLRSSLLFRNAWGLVRVSLTFIDSPGEG